MLLENFNNLEYAKKQINQPTNQINPSKPLKTSRIHEIPREEKTPIIHLDPPYYYHPL